MIVPQDYDVRQSGRGLKLQHRDLWLRPTDLSWHFLLLVTIRGMPFKSYRARSPAKLKVREDKTEEAKKQKIPKNSDEKRLHQMEVFIWQKWSADETRERTSYQSADWDNSHQACERSDWQASADWEHLRSDA